MNGFEALPDNWSLRRRRGTLNRRETEILAYKSRGLTDDMTADAMLLSPETVKDYLRSARYALGAKTTPHAVAEAIRRKLIP